LAGGQGHGLTLSELASYLFRHLTPTFLRRSESARHVVQVCDQSGRILMAVLTIPVVRQTAADDTRALEEQRTGALFPIKTWCSRAI
jgi:hypothetical protein